MQGRSRTTANLIWLLLIFAFSACVVAAILQAASVYNRVSTALDEQFGIHTGLSYVSSRLRSADFEGGVSVGEFDGCSAIFCADSEAAGAIAGENYGESGAGSADAGGGEYVTAIYCYNGSLRELYCEKGADFDADAGEILIPMDSLTFQDLGNGLILAKGSVNGADSSIYLHLRAAGGAGYEE